jgi:SAM-dependent methyltransferase
VLEIACGSGQHACHFAGAFSDLSWRPTDIDEAARMSTASWIEHERLTNVRAPIHLDTRTEDWPVDSVDAIFCANMIHISPWECTMGLMRGAGRYLSASGVLVTYGPYHVGGRPTAPSNASFDASLRSRDPHWGIRDLEAVVAEAGKNGLALIERVSMPANNFTLIFRRPPTDADEIFTIG